MFGAHALACRRRVEEALALLAPMPDEFRRRGFGRRGVPENFRAWILRNLGAFGEADEANETARAVAPDSVQEQSVQAELDLLAGRLLARDSAGGHRLLDSIDGSTTEWTTMVWRLWLRRHLLAGRLALLDEDFELARRRAADVVESATIHRSPRHAAMGRLLDAEAAFRSGDGADREEVDRVLQQMLSFAALEAWWVAAALAEAAGESRWTRFADEQVGRLAAAAGSYGETLIQAAQARLEHAP